MDNKSLVTLILTALNWIAAVFGVAILCAGFAFLPALFGLNDPGMQLFELNGLVFTKGAVMPFSLSWSIGILLVGTVLYTWICSIFAMSTHLLVVSFSHEMTMGQTDANQHAWLVAAILGFIATIIFVFVLYGTLFTMPAISLALLLSTVVSFILVLNYPDSRGQKVELRFFLK